MEQTLEPLMTIPEVAEYLKISKSKVYYMVKKNEIPHIRLGKNVRVFLSDLIQWLKVKKSQEPSQLVFVIDNAIAIGSQQ
jgi:excisionase family DNA binding protein